MQSTETGVDWQARAEYAEAKNRLLWENEARFHAHDCPRATIRAIVVTKQWPEPECTCGVIAWVNRFVSVIGDIRSEHAIAMACMKDHSKSYTYWSGRANGLAHALDILKGVSNDEECTIVRTGPESQ